MFSTKLTRVALNRTVSAASFSSQATTTASPCIVARRARQRRPAASSKLPGSPDSCKTAPIAKPDAAAAAPTTAISSPATPAQPAATRTRTARPKRAPPSMSEKVASRSDVVDHFAGLPVVPDMQHLQQSQFGLSSFFSLHRPLSLTTTIPPPSSEEAFHRIFETPATTDAWENGNSAERRPEHVIYTLHNTIESLEAGASAGSADTIQWEVVQEQNGAGGLTHLDGVKPKVMSLDDVVARFKPFNPPPPPEPFPQNDMVATSEKKQRKRRASTSTRPRSFATITNALAESAVVDVPQDLTASPRSIFELPEATRHRVLRAPPQMIRQPFLTRMHRRRQLYAQDQPTPSTARAPQPTAMVSIRRAPGSSRTSEKMQLISVKRQRKLKMKKHKYKKLMKRTRNLRRRLDRA
nr:hypothetical protein CFP56_62776 [Quercus suber]